MGDAGADRPDGTVSAKRRSPLVEGPSVGNARASLGGGGWARLMEGRGGYRGPVVSLYWRVLVINAIILVLAALLLSFTLATVSVSLRREEQALIVVAGLLVSLVANGALLRVGLAPLERLKAAMGDVDVLRPGGRLPADSGVTELNELASAFNQMLSRLEDERRLSATRAWTAEEAERRRLSRDLHDEIGQRLTAVLLYLKRSAATAGEPTRSELEEAQAAIRDALDEVRSVLRQLRPEALDELGLTSALAELASGFAAPTGLGIQRQLPSDLPRMASTTELAIYRVAQEALTNVARHADATEVTLELGFDEHDVTMLVTDNGDGTTEIVEAGGIRGMRERAVQMNGSLSITSTPGQGTTLRLVVPLTSNA